ncbi:hydrolase 1, exosortase A system-associated [Pelagerythrobacter marensis]|uniref:Hydrolase 1, exosortase A system-associated n=1 Tax=Pelagerythrobacter marensis TaxID=543877 RepID=A0ABZ2D0A7_9SPHN
MNRLPLTFACEDQTLAGTIDTAPASVGLLIVSGGNEIRAGAFSGQARLAERIARAGFPVFRFDRRGVGDSEGKNRGFRASAKDIAAAIDAFRAMAPQMKRVVAFGNCDAASALMLASGAGCDALVLSNPWTIEDEQDDLPPSTAIRSRYLEKLKNPGELARLVTGRVDFRKLARGLARAALPRSGPGSLAQEMAAGLERFEGPVRILLAETDRTAQAFAEAWDLADSRIARCPGASHAYVEPHARDWLFEQLLGALRDSRA